MENPFGIIVVVVIVIIIVAVIVAGTIANQKRKAASWTGVVVDKNIQESVQQNNNYNNYNDRADGSSGMSIRIGGIGFGNGGFRNNGSAVTHSYSISVRPDGGEVFSWSVSSGFYETVNIGDRLSKPAGTLTPEIIEKAQAPADQTPPSAPTQSMPPAAPSL